MREKRSYADVVKMKADYEMSRGYKPTQLRIGKRAFDEVIYGMDMPFQPGSTIHTLGGLTVLWAEDEDCLEIAESGWVSDHDRTGASE